MNVKIVTSSLNIWRSETILLWHADPKNYGTTFFRNVGDISSSNTVSYARRTDPSTTPTVEIIKIL
jgi:hypothetical protein